MFSLTTDKKLSCTATLDVDPKKADATSDQEPTLALVGGTETDGAVWAESRSLQGAALGRTSFAPGELRAFLDRTPSAVVRPSAGIAYLPYAVAPATPEPVRRLQDRVRERFDPSGVLA